MGESDLDAQTDMVSVDLQTLRPSTQSHATALVFVLATLRSHLGEL